jgi:nuclear pore complex protein Nup107
MQLSLMFANCCILDERRAQLEEPEDHEDILHPLREAANRVGREVELFAQALDGYNPLSATAKEERHEKTLDLIEIYHNIALETVHTLRERHAADVRKKDGLRWRKKMRGFKIAQDDDELEDESDEMQNSSTQTTLEDLARWEQEAQTWDLLRRLVHLRYPSPDSNGTASRAVSQYQPLHQYSTEREVWDRFLETDDLALERKTVLDWLKDTSEESGEDIDVLVKDLQQNADRGDIIAHGWLHTKAAIKNQKRIHVWPQALDPSSAEVQRALLSSTRSDSLITQLDPDAMARQNRKLEAQDEYFERSIWLGCYEMLRRGRPSNEIREWCMERTEVWRAVSMSGLPDEQSNDDDEAGNLSSSALWRRMCFDLARKSGGDKYERAVYGILSGDISSVEEVCSSWDDFIFMHYNALLRTQFDNYVQRLLPERGIAVPFGVFDAVQFHGEPKTVGKRLVDTLKTHPRTAAETLLPMKMLQGVLIANDFDHFIYQQGLALAKLANTHGSSNLIPATKEQPEDGDMQRYIALDDHDSLRVLTHVLLILIGLGLDLGGAYRQTVVENVIVSYVSFLRLAGKEELIPLYCSQLSGNRRYATLCRNLIDVTSSEQRIMQINLMKQLGLDVQEFVKFQSRYLFADFPDDSNGYPATGRFSLLEDATEPNENGQKLRRDFFGDDPDKVERVDMLFIRSLEWYLLVDGLWSETFLFGTMLYLRFFSKPRTSSSLNSTLLLTISRAHASYRSSNVSVEGA